jgi:hypothetical protein
MRKIEKILEIAFRFIYNDFQSSYATLRSNAKQPLMYVRRIRSVMAEVFNVVNKQSPSYLHNMFSVKECMYSSRKFMQLDQPKFKTVKYGYNRIRYQGAKLWNELDNVIKQAMSITEFKHLMSQWEGSQCNCSSCQFCAIKQM